MHQQENARQQPLSAPLGNQNKNSLARDVPNIIVMVGGTVDPVNLSPDARSASYRKLNLAEAASDANWYWEGNEKLRDALTALRKKYNNLHLFVAHGWSGDNSATNRRIAGAYLADRLCGGNGEKPYYQAFLKGEASFHLIGHSHGGNVINEFAHRAATSKDWPKGWKIRSITYLSTPFFTRLHPVNTGAFAADCRLLNVFCKYDLTQRVIADFSMLPLTGLLEQAGIPKVIEQISRLSFDTSLLTDALTSVDVHFSLKNGLEVPMDAEAASKLYREVLRLLEDVHKVFTQLRAVVERLNKGIEYPVPKELDAKLKKHRQVMSNGLAAKFRHELSRIESGLTKTEAAFRDRIKRGRFPRKGFFEDLHIPDVLTPLLDFISVDRTTLSGPLWNLVCQLLVEQIDVFDNTTTTPAAQLKGTPFANRLVNIDITSYDAYSTQGRDVAFEKFIGRLEGIEANYARSRTSYDLMDLLFTLLAHIEPLRATAERWATVLDWYEGFMRPGVWVKSKLGLLSQEEKLFAQVVKVLESFALVIQQRNCGQLQVNKPTLKLPPGTPPLGSIPYLAIVAHSTSRQDLYPKVKSALEAQFDTRTRASR